MPKAVEHKSDWNWGITRQAQYCGKGFVGYIHRTTGIPLVMSNRPCCQLTCPKCAVLWTEEILGHLNGIIPETTWYGVMEVSGATAERKKIVQNLTARSKRQGSKRFVVQIGFPRTPAIAVLASTPLVGRKGAIPEMAWVKCDRDRAMKLVVGAMAVPGVLHWPSGSAEWVAPNPNTQRRKEEKDKSTEWRYIGRNASRTRILDVWHRQALSYEAAYGHMPGAPPKPLEAPDVFWGVLVDNLDSGFVAAMKKAKLEKGRSGGGTRTRTGASY